MGFKELRSAMVQEQLVRRGISDSRVLDAFRTVERHKFVPGNAQKNAYDDCPLTIGNDQTISQPYMVALMTQCLELRGDEKVLEIGTGSGYQTAILAALCKSVYSVERIKELADRAMNTLQELGYANIHIKIDDGTLGWNQEAPFDAIIVTAGAPDIPETLLGQLGVYGKIAIPVGDRSSQMLRVVIKSKEKCTTKDICGCIFVPLLGKYGWN
ncbi:protein-L-isoaspartate(D-aspartate) O-methyltransferase [Candidatus Omnitrophota bacterium]